ncbi:hypothetical protein [Lentilactobacillus kosonis]|uniref:Uncharacterized protein n=1 Tax=Lentilactobacillus kosonis TaxID=2810561 RepID=A0A401FI55_9LACO|nr:hypothetical protein [Lentilactobacillus kosonis]GAY71976.1 hypothetical protein, lipoprotein [Lentilactobacillus kosonis]
MKRWIWILVAIIVAGSIGGYAYARHSQNNRLYDQQMTRGNAYIASKKYSSAETAFTNALKRKQDDKKATTFLKQTQTFVSAQKALNDRKFSESKQQFTDVKNTDQGNEQLIDRAKTNLATLKTVQANIKNYNKVYNQALDQAGEGQYMESNASLDKIFNDKAIHQTYYKDVLKKAEKLRDDNNKAINGQPNDQSTVDNDDDSSSTAVSPNLDPDSSSSNSQSNTNTNPDSSSASLTPEEQKQADNYKGSNEYTVKPGQNEIDGQEITNAQVNTARRDLQQSGFDTGAMSDQDVKNLIKGASEKNQSVTDYAKQTLK